MLQWIILIPRAYTSPMSQGESGVWSAQYSLLAAVLSLMAGMSLIKSFVKLISSARLFKG